MGNLLMKRIRSNTSIDNVKQTSIGIVTVILVYLGNYFFIQNNPIDELDITTMGLLAITLFVLVTLFVRFYNYQNEELKRELSEFFDLKDETDFLRLGERVHDETTNRCLFQLKRYRITGTANYLVIDTEKKNFHLLPAKKIQRLEIQSVGRGIGVVITIAKGEEVVVVFKNETEANKLYKKIQENYLKI